MFSAMVRAAAVLIAGSLIFLAISMGGGALVDMAEQESDATGDPDYQGNWRWGDVVVTWWPLVVVATIATILIGSAILKRGQTRI